MNPPSTTLDPVLFDVREIPCRVKHAQIFLRWLDLPLGQHFVLVNDHDPVPLYYQFAAEFPGAFAWEYLVRGPEEFQVRITKLVPVAAPRILPTPPAPPARPAAPDESREVDARGLVPPEPLLRILNALEELPPGEKLRAITDREPCHLFGEAESRGFRHTTAARPDGSWVTCLERA
jgi:uncharacterized protein (DUF2249 family)